MIRNEDIIAKYVHGSQDSTDIDICYVLNRIPEFKEAQEFCAEGDESDNRNVMHISDGVVDYVFKGSVDEVNNAILSTYELHEQDYPLLIEKKLERDVPVKILRSVRIILSHLSRCQYRSEIKSALKGDWTEKLTMLKNLNMHDIDWDLIDMNSKMDKLSTRKTIAFQIGQTMALIFGHELYTKIDIADLFPMLGKSLYREDSRESLFGLEMMFRFFVGMIENIRYGETSNNEIVCFPQFSGDVYLIAGEKKI